MTYEITRWRWPGRQMTANVSRAFLGRSSFYLLVDFFPPRTLNYPNALKDIAWTNLFLKASVISLCVPVSQSTCFFSICVHCRRRFPSPLGACFFCLSLWSSDRFQHQGAVPSASDVARATELTRLARVRWARARKEKCVSLTSVHVKEEEGGQEVGCCSFLRLFPGRQWNIGEYTRRHSCKGARWK